LCWLALSLHWPGQPVALAGALSLSLPGAAPLCWLALSLH
jgi:hypothetical protein